MQVAETFTFELDEAMQKQLLGSRPAGAADKDAGPAASGSKQQKQRRKQKEEEEEEEDVACPLRRDHNNMPGTLSSIARLDTCATVVDASAFFANLHSIEELSDRWGSWTGLPEETEAGMFSWAPGMLAVGNIEKLSDRCALGMPGMTAGICSWVLSTLAVDMKDWELGRRHQRHSSRQRRVGGAPRQAGRVETDPEHGLWLSMRLRVLCPLQCLFSAQAY
jgi:hypothetical protein